MKRVCCLLAFFYSIYSINGLNADSELVNSCAPRQCPAGEKFSYEPGRSYIYNYQVNVVTTISGATKDFTSIFIEAQAEINAITRCELTLKLRNVNLRSRDVDDPAPKTFASGHQQFKEALEKWTLRFSFEDGAIETVCAESAEEPWALNIKRGLVSILQNRANINSVSTTQMLERDIQGSCPTEYTIDYVWTNLTSKKTKDLDKCKERHVFLSAIQSSPYLSLEMGQLNPALRSSYSCKQDIVNEIIHRVSCDERHILRPFSNGDGGAMTMTQQTLVLIDEIHQSVAPRVSAMRLRKTTLLFDHDYKSNRQGRADALQNQHEAEMALYHLCSLSPDGVHENSPLHFWQLVNALKELDHPKLKELYDNTDRICDFSPRGRNLFLDALPMIGSPSSVTLMRELILNGSVSTAKEDTWLQMVAFHPQPTKDILAAIMPLLKSSPHPPPKALLSITALANSYCQTVSNCSTNVEIRELIGIIERQLGPRCRFRTTDEIEKAIVALKAFGNLGLGTATGSILENCISTIQNPTIVRLSAVAAYRRLSCNIRRDHLLRLFLNTKEDSEIRIVAYWGIMRCPSYDIINDIWKSLHHESVNQVNSFVWSHLNTIQKSVDPAKMPLRAIIEDVELKQKYSRDVRKFSRVYEKSAFSEILNVGANLETHLIYSPVSFIPRSAMLNLTVDLFGQSINLVELNGRIEGLDRLAESLFRPVPHSAEIKINSEDTEDTEKPKRPPKHPDIQALSQKIRSHMKSLSPMTPDAIFSMKVFGQEVWYNHMKKAELESTIQQWLHYSYADFLTFLSTDNDVDFTRDSILMDSTYITPTLAGLPLILALNATASVHLKMGGRMDIRRLANGVCDIQGQIRPSAAVSVLGSMTVDGYVGKSGVAIDASLHSSTVLDGKVELTDNMRVKVHFNLPNEKVNFVQVSTNMHLNHWGRKSPLRSNTIDRTEVLSCSTELTSKLLGIEFCSEFRYPNASQRFSSPYFPLTGPSRICLWLQKTDRTLSAYHFDYHLDKGSGSPSVRSPRSFMLSVHTPHSTEDREWAINYSDNPTDKSMHLRLATPYKKVLIKGHYSDDDTRKGLYADVTIDGREEFSFQAEIRMTSQNSYNHYLPRIIIRVPTHVVMSLEGDIRYNSSHYIGVDVTIKNLTIKSIIFRGEVIKIVEEDDNIHYSCVLNSPIVDATMKGSLNNTRGGLVSKTHLEYQLAEVPKKETVDLTMKIRYVSPPSRSLTTATAVIDIHTSAAPQYNSIVNWNFQLAEGHIENTIVVDSTDNGRKTQIARLQQILKYEGTLEDHKVKSKFEVKVPSRNVHVAFTVDHLNKFQMLSSRMFLKRDVHREYGIEVQIRDDSTHLWQVRALTLVHWNGVVNGLTMNVSETTRHHYLILMSAHGRPFGNLNATIHYKNNSTDIYLDHVVRTTVTGDIEATAVASLFVMEDRGTAKLDAEVDGRTYQLEGTYKKLRPQQYESQFAFVTPTYRFDGVARFNVTDEKALQFDCRSSGGRRVVGMARFKYLYDVKGGALYLAWDADSDPSQQFNVSLLDEQHLDYSRKYVHLVFLERAIGLTFDHCQRGSPFATYFSQKTDVLVEWAAARKLAVDLDVKMNSVLSGHRDIIGTLDVLTPLSAMETVLVNVTHHDDGLSWKSEGAVLVNRRWPFRVASEGKYWRAGNQQYIDSSTNITTPIQNFERIGVNLEHHLASREIKTIVQVHWAPGNNIDIRVYGILPKSRYDMAVVNVNATTPFAALHRLGFAIDHKLNPGHINSRMCLHWNDQEKFSVLLSGDSKRQGVHYQVLGNFLMVTPLEGFNNLTVDVDHSHDPNGFNTRLYTILPRDNVFSWHSSGRFQRVTQSVVLEGNFDLDSPVVRFGTGIRYDRNGAGFESNLRGHWNTTFANFTAVGAYEALTNFRLQALLTTSLEGLRATSLIARNNVTGSFIATQLSGKMGNAEGGVVLDGLWDFRSPVCRSLSVAFRLDSPLSALPHVTLNVTHGCKGQFGHCTRVHGTWNHSRMTLNHTLYLQDRLNFRDVLEFSVPFDNLQHVSLAVNQSLSLGVLNNSLELVVDHAKLMGSSVDFRKSSSAAGQREIDAVLRLDSSIWLPSRMEVIVDHSDNGRDYRPKVVIRTMEPSNTLLQLTGDLKNSLEGKTGHLVINTPIEQYENVELGGGYSVSDTLMAFNMSTSWNSTYRFALNGEIGIDFFEPHLSLDVATPNAGYRTFKLDGRYNVWSSNKRASFFVQKEDWMLHLAGSGTFELDAMAAGLVVVTPSPMIGTIHLNASGSWDPPNIRGFKTVLSWNDKKTIMVATTLQPYKNGVTTLTTSVVTPIRWIRNIDWIIKVSREPNSQLMVETSTRWNRADMVDVTVGLLQTASVPIDVSFTVRSTTSSVPRVAAVFRIETSTSRQALKLEVTSGSTKLKTNVQLRHRGKRTDLEVDVETSAPQFPKGSLRSNWRRKGQNYDITVTLSLPFSGMDSTTIVGVVSAVRGNVSRGALTVRTASQASVLTMEQVSNDSGVGIGVHADPPVTMLEISEFKFSYKIQPSESAFRWSVTDKSGRHDIDIQVVGPHSNLRVKGHIASPLLKEKNPLDVDIQLHAGDLVTVYCNVIIKEVGVDKHHLLLDVKVREPTSASVQFLGTSSLFGDGQRHEFIVEVAKTARGLTTSTVLTWSPRHWSHWNSTYERDLTSGLILFSVDAASSLTELEQLQIHAKKVGREWDNVALNLDIQTPIDGYNKFNTAITTKHVTGKVFDFRVYIDTPFEGYEQIGFEESLEYDFAAMTCITNSNFTFDGVTTSFGAWYIKLGQSMDVGVDTRWRPTLGGDEQVGIGEVRGKIGCPTADSDKNLKFSGRLFCVAEFLLKGTRWEGEGFWNHSSWRAFQGEVFIDTPFRSVQRVGLKACNEMPTGQATVRSQLALHWAGRRVADVQIRGSVLPNGRKQGIVNITTPFSLVRRVDGHGFVLRNEDGTSGRVDIDVNGQTLFSGATELFTLEGATWKNRTVKVDLENPWQPFGILVLTSGHSDVLIVNSSLAWNLVERDAHSLRSILKVLYNSFGRSAHLVVVHPIHQFDLVTSYQKLPSNFTHATSIHLGTSKATLLAYELWLRSDGSEEVGIRRNTGFRWEHPGRVVACDAEVFRRPQRYQTVLNFQWDASKDEEKRMKLNMDYEDASSRHDKAHRVKMVFHHPKLSRDVELNSYVILSQRADSFQGNMTLQYSPFEQARLDLNAGWRRSSASDKWQSMEVDFMAKHAISNLNLELSSEWIKSSESLATNTSFIYLDRHSERIQFGLKGLGELLKENAVLVVHNSGHSTKITMMMHHPEPNNYTLILTKNVNSQPHLVTNIFYQPNSPYLEARATSVKDDHGYVLFSAGLKTVRQYILQILHGRIGHEVRDFSAVVNLNNTHFLTTRVYWVSNILFQVKEIVGQYLSSAHNQTMESLWHIWDLSLEEVASKFELGWESFAMAMLPMFNELKNELDIFIDDFTEVGNFLAQIYPDGDPLYRDVIKKLEAGRKYFRAWISKALGPFTWNFDNISYYAEDNMQYLKRTWQSIRSSWNSLSNSWMLQIWDGIFETFLVVLNLIDELWERLSGLLGTLPTAITNMMANLNTSSNEMKNHFYKLIAVGDQIKSFWEKIYGVFDGIKTWIKEKIIDAFKQWIFTSEIYLFLRAQVINAFNGFVNFIRYYWLELLVKWMNIIKLYMMENQKKVVDSVINNLRIIRDAIWAFIPNIISNPGVRNSVEAIKAVHNKVIWLLQYHKMIPEGYLTLFEWYGYWTEMFTRTAEESSNRFDSSNYVLFQTENGLIEVDQQLPFPWKSLKESPQIQEMKEIKAFYELWQMLNSYNAPVPYNSFEPPFLSWYNKLQKQLDYRTWFPPFEGQAILAGRQHYVTFDGRVVQFAGACSYLLSHDFMDGNITATINYDSHYRGRPVKQSIILWMDGKEIEILPNFQVFVDGRKIELPHSYHETAIIREADQTIVKTGYGVTVTCHWTYDVCTFKVSGWYFGRLAGLLGTYNYEPVDDVITPDGITSLDQLGNWGNTWAINQPHTCHLMENLVVEAPRKDPLADFLCMDLFNNTFSLFKYCFERVDPLPFLNMCLSDIQTLHTPEDVCTSAEAYVRTCHANDVLLRIPKICVKCHLPNGQVLNEAENITVNSPVRMADVVIIIEAKKCNRAVVDIFRDLVYNIDSAMHDAAVTERRYATVVFGGSGVYDAPHVLTSDTGIFTNHRTMPTLHNFKVGRGTHDFFDALRFAAKLPFRPGASKSLVVLTCSIGESVAMRKDYPEVHRMLLEDGITVHLLLDREFEATRSDLLLYGIDGVKAYTSKDSRSHFRFGDPDLRRQVMPPKDICVPVVLESNGTVFSSLRLNNTKKMIKSFLDVYSRRIAQSAETLVCQACDCFPNDNGVGRIYCQPCVFPRPSHYYVDPSNFYDTEHMSIHHALENNHKGDFDEFGNQEWRISNRPPA